MDLDPVWGSEFDPGLFDRPRRGTRRTDVEVDRRRHIIDDDQVAQRAIAEDPVDAEREPQELEVAEPSPQECEAAQDLPTSREPGPVEPAICTCSWCEQPFEPRKDGGSPRRFCCTSCRRAYDGAARAYVRHAIDDGTLSLENLRRALASSARAGPGGKEDLDVVR
jgi:hypothetical protein